tara:strand:+ start:1053 stop:1370 length:318 start_codon:yes stop_codon:yes gene_type:complete
MYNYRAKLIRCIDGDTVEFDVDLGLKLTARLRCRLIGVNTPERGHVDYKTATNELKKLIVANMDDRGNVNVRTYKTGKYGRWLVEIGENGTVNKAMAEKWPWHGP